MTQITSTPSFTNENNIFMGARYNYLPTSFKNASGAAWGIRKRVWAFKDGDRAASRETADWVSTALESRFPMLDDCVFVCIPASTAEINDARYTDFAYQVCKATGMTNGISKIKIESDRVAIHEYRVGKSISKVQVLKFDKKFFNGRKVIIFDDVITKGSSLATMVDALEELGATVIGALFLARTVTAEQETA